MYGEDILVKWESGIELNVLSDNNFCNNSSYRLLNVGYVPVTVKYFLWLLSSNPHKNTIK